MLIFVIYSIHFLVTGTAVVISEFGDVCDTVVGPGHWFGEVGIMEKVRMICEAPPSMG